MSLEREFEFYSQIEACGKQIELKGSVLKRLPAHEVLRQMVFDRKPLDIDLCNAFVECLNETLDLAKSRVEAEHRALDLREENLALKEEINRFKRGDRS